MPAAALIGCLAVLSAPLTGPAAAQRPVNPTPPSVTVTVATAGSVPAYRVQVRNPGRNPVATTVRQTLPPGTSATSISNGGQAIRSTGRAGPNEVTWQVTVPAAGTTTLRTAIRPTRPGQPLALPTCVYDRFGGTPYDCATATWQGTSAAPDRAEPPPLWRRPPVLVGVLAAVLALSTGTPLWRRHRRRRALSAYPEPGHSTTTDPAAAERARHGTVYPRPDVPPPAGRRRRPPVWLVVTAATALLAGVVGGGAWAATTRVSAMNSGPQPTSGAWVGRAAVGAVGSTLHDAAFEFTVYRVTCPPDGTRRRCEAIVGVRNLTAEKQLWHGQLQRAYLPSGTWVGADEGATRAANEGRDVFGTPVPAGGRLLLPLVFTVDGPPNQLELRSGVFSAGVRVNVH